ncbi:MAG: hypothetical protein ACYC8V_03195, partial [Caulobacteraceae bacterium]
LAVALDSIAILLPGRLWQAGQWVRPYAAASAAIAAAPSQVVLVDETGVWFGRHLVRNDPFLRNRPLVLDAALLDRAQLREICSRYTVTLFDRTQAAKFGMRLYREREADWAAILPALGCASVPF